MGCQKCGKDATILVCLSYHNHHTLCQTCHMHLFPFKMELTYTRSHCHLYNNTLKMEEPVMTIDMFVKCGWFQRKKVERRNYIYYILEYHGKVKCSRCVGYHWPLIMKEECELYNVCARPKDLYNESLIG